MFDVGKRYEFEMLDNVDKRLIFFKAEVLETEGSLLKLLHDDEEEEEIFNANSMVFIRAKEIEPEAALIEELAAKEIGAREPEQKEAL
jgi:hypothetical protein